MYSLCYLCFGQRYQKSVLILWQGGMLFYGEQKLFFVYVFFEYRMGVLVLKEATYGLENDIGDASCANVSSISVLSAVALILLIEVTFVNLQSFLFPILIYFFSWFNHQFYCFQDIYLNLICHFQCPFLSLCYLIRYFLNLIYQTK